MRRALIAAAAWAAFFAARDGRAQSVAPPAVAEADLEEQLGGALPTSLTLRDSSGRAFPLAEAFSGRVPTVVILAYFRCPALCPMVIDGTLRGLFALDGLRAGRDFRLLVVSIDPRDTPRAAELAKQRALQAAGHPEATDAVRFLVGDAGSISALERALGFHFAWDARTGQYAHPAAITFVSPRATITRYLYGVSFPARDLRFALVEAGEGRVGTIVDRVLITCYAYDPATRRYGLTVLATMRIGAAAILLAVGLLLALLWRRERRRPEEPR